MQNSENNTDIKQYFKEKVIGKYVRVVLTDERRIYGNLHCIDKHKNMVIIDAIQEINEKYVAPINETLKFFVKNELRPEKYLQIPESILKDEEQKKILDKEI